MTAVVFTVVAVALAVLPAAASQDPARAEFVAASGASDEPVTALAAVPEKKGLLSEKETPSIARAWTERWPRTETGGA